MELDVVIGYINTVDISGVTTEALAKLRPPANRVEVTIWQNLTEDSDPSFVSTG